MKRYKTGTAIAFLLVAAATAPEVGRAETADALAGYALTDPATGKTGSVQVNATAVISENMVLEYVTPMNLRISGTADDPESLRLTTAGTTGGRPSGARGNPPNSAAISVHGLPNQTFAVSINQATRSAKGQGNRVVATFTHNAGQTPHIGPAGDTEFVIGATLRMTRNTARHGYSGILDLIVSHN